MVARFAGAGLGLFAFSVTVVGGLYAQNPVSVTLSRSVLALFLFCVIGLVLGTAAQMVVDEHEKSRTAGIREKYQDKPVEPVGAGAETGSSSEDEAAATA